MERIPINKYPYTDFHEINLDWVIERIQEMYSIIDQKIADAIAPINAQINTINGRLDTIETNYNNLSQTVSNHTNLIAQHSMQIQGLGNTVGDILGDISTINSDITELQTTTEGLQTVVGVHTTEIADIYNKIAEIDPDTGLIIDADGFNIEPKTASVLDPVYRFNLTGASNEESFVIYPDLIPGTQSGYYPRVTLQSDPVTNKVKLPAELTTGAFPLIRRGTFATNIDKSAEVYAGDPLEYSFSSDNRFFYIDGYDSDAIILMNIACLHHTDIADAFENVFDNYGITDVKGMPMTDANGYTGIVSRGTSSTVVGFDPYIYFFNKSGDLLSYASLTFEGVAIPTGTYSIWFGIGTSSEHERWTNTTCGINLSTCAGVYRLESDSFTTYDIVRFSADGEDIDIYTYKNGINGLYGYDNVDMFTGEIKRGGIHYKDVSVIGSLSDLDPDKAYTVSLPYAATGYTDAKLKYNKIMVILNGLDANNVRY